jgi:hypothetical protein
MSEIRKLSMPETSGRVETGPIQFGDDDWPGVFLRGDNAFHAAMLMEQASKLTSETDALLSVQLQGLAQLFGSCVVK